MKTPYLIQRAEIKRPLNKFDGSKLSGAVSFEYMGSAEFEFGAVPAAFREFRANHDKVKVSKVGEIVDDQGRTLRVYHYLSDEDFAIYVGHLKDLRKDKLRTKEVTYFGPCVHYKPKTDFWWDIVNNVIWSFDKEFMKRLDSHMQESFKILKD